MFFQLHAEMPRWLFQTLGARLRVRVLINVVTKKKIRKEQSINIES